MAWASQSCRVFGIVTDRWVTGGGRGYGVKKKVRKGSAP